MEELKVMQKVEEGKITCNFAEIDAYAQEIKERYSGIIVTEDTVVESKKDIATLRKLYKSLDEARKQTKEQWMTPYMEFEAQLKQSLAKIQEPIAELDRQVKEFEAQRKEEKKKKIREIFEEAAGEMKEYISLDRIYDARWENKSTSEKAIREDIEEVIDSCKMAVGTIKSMNSDCQEEALEKYKLDLSLPNAISFINAYEARKAQIIQREKERLEAQQREEEKRRIEMLEAQQREEQDEAFVAAAEADTEDDVPSFVPADPEAGERQWHVIQVYCTEDEYMDIIAELAFKGIKAE